ncbi:iron-containing redox enzyme family protein [Streptomyces sp. NPDC057418]|uniref:iron-containing redox enzyme family protein n=2 Tax=unclassified Streptomyces TaxID=2593676 RepID=UPI00368FF8EE
MLCAPMCLEAARPTGSSTSCWWSTPIAGQRRSLLITRGSRGRSASTPLHHLKEADAHARVIPRLRGRAEAGMVATAHDGLGAGRAENMHTYLVPTRGSGLPRSRAQTLR